MIDESIDDRLAGVIASMSAFSAVFVRDIKDLRGKPDTEVMRRAQAENRIVLTTDSGFNRTNYPICRHEGIIRISTRCRHSSTMEKSVIGFSHCGHRSSAKHAITVLHEGGCMIETIDGSNSYRYPK
jgi:predicted nuclease of predicted toxin-antitoxin system